MLSENVKEAIAGMASADREAALLAGRQLWNIVRRAGRPGAAAERKSVVEQLIDALRREQPGSVHRELLWMLSEIGGGESVEDLAAFLSDRQLREDARMALERIPGDQSLGALQRALAGAPDDFQHALVQSLRARGVEVVGFPSRKLLPTKTTRVKPLA